MAPTAHPILESPGFETKRKVKLALTIETISRRQNGQGANNVWRHADSSDILLISLLRRRKGHQYLGRLLSHCLIWPHGHMYRFPSMWRLQQFEGSKLKIQGWINNYAYRPQLNDRRNIQKMYFLDCLVCTQNDPPTVNAQMFSSIFVQHQK